MSSTGRAFLLAVLLAVALFSHVEGRSVLAKKSAKNTAKEPVKVVYNTDYPYACTLNNTAAETLCSGILVNSSWVATAAHCVNGASASDITLFCDGSDFPLEVSAVVVHEEWLSIATLPYDIAMVQLEKESDLPVLALADVNTTLVNGTLKVLETDFDDVEKQKATAAEHVEPTACNSTFLWTRSIDDSMVCATTETGDCMSEGASGLLFVPDDEEEPTVLVGIASFETRACRRYEFPMVYTSIVTHGNWIQRVIDGDETDSALSSSEEAALIKNVTKEYETKNSTMIIEAAKAAIAVDDSLTLSVLLDLGLSPDATVDEYGRSLLHFCADSDAYACAKLLVAYGANVGILEDLSSATPLHFAAYNGSISVAKVLLEAGAYVNAVADDHLTPLHYVTISPTGKLTVMKFLLDSGANVHEVDNGGATPLHYAAAANWVSATKVLIRNGANLVVYADDDGSPLHWAARAGADDTLIVLLEAGTLVEIKPKTGLRETALLFALRFKAPLSTIKILVESGANVNVADVKGRTPLHRAAKDGRKAVIKFLLANGANTRAKNMYGNGPRKTYCTFNPCYTKANAPTRKSLAP